MLINHIIGLLIMDAIKKLGPLEAINGVLMIGVSTASLMALFRDAMQKTFEARKKMRKTA